MGITSPNFLLSTREQDGIDFFNKSSMIVF